MFEMFRGGKPDPMTLMAVEQEERRSDLNRVIRFIKLHCTHGMIDVDAVAAECGVYDLSQEEASYIENGINKR